MCICKSAYVDIYIHVHIFTCMYIYICMSIYTQKYMYIYVYVYTARSRNKNSYSHKRVYHIQVGEDAQDAFSCKSLSAKEPLIIGLFCGKCPLKIRHPMHLRHPAC